MEFKRWQLKDVIADDEKMAYAIEFAESVRTQLRYLNARQRTLIFASIEKQLVHQPLAETINRKFLRPNPIALWELHIGNLRVFYEVTADEPDVVKILAIGQKKGNKLFIAEKEVKL
jgi:mRNA-degrading endonuclease RelE of RelBE toxin-antitoxin system